MCTHYNNTVLTLQLLNGHRAGDRENWRTKVTPRSILQGVSHQQTLVDPAKATLAKRLIFEDGYLRFWYLPFIRLNKRSGTGITTVNTGAYKYATHGHNFGTL